ncbi:integrase catalytic domain-containing protein [Trichonephila clavipes]|nr:integrase catalytic domain-containing protein [Trichonephila clavipes]
MVKIEPNDSHFESPTIRKNLHGLGGIYLKGKPSRLLSADCLLSNSRWWTGAEFLSDSEFPKNFQQVVLELDYLTEHEKETVVQERKKLPEADRSEETVLLFNYNCRNKSKKVGPLTVAEFKESEIKLIKRAQRSLFDKKEIPSCISKLFPFVDGEGIVRVGGRLEKCFCAISP